MRSGLAHQAPDVGGKGPRSSGGGVHTLGAQRPGPLGGDSMAAPSRGGVCAEQTGHWLRAQSQADAVGTRLQPREATAARSCPGAGRAGGLRASLGARVGPSRPKGRQLPQTRTCQPSRKGGQQSGPSQERSWGRRGGPRIKPSLSPAGPGGSQGGSVFSRLELLNGVQRDDLTSTSVSGVSVSWVWSTAPRALGADGGPRLGSRKPSPLHPPRPGFWVPRVCSAGGGGPSCPADSRPREPSSDALGLSQPPGSGQEQKGL